MRLRTPITAPKGRKLRVLIYGRYSTEEQDASSIKDQFTLCRAFLKDADVEEVDITELSDVEISGELADRPGINQVRDGIEEKRWDVLICEDSSRLFRNHTACFELVEGAVDEDIRVICIGDFVDTAEEDWEIRLHEAQRHHTETNRFLRRRLWRKMQGLWKLGAAVGLLRPGYRRVPSTPALDNDPAEGPFFDEIDPKWESTIVEAYQRIANDDPSWLVGAWLGKVGLPKSDNSKTNVWDEKNTNALIRRLIYRGFDVHRTTIQKRKRRSGKKRTVRNDPAEVWTREMPHLRIVPDWLWYKANQAIAQRDNNKGNISRGDDHPLTGIPRDSRGPISEIFICDISEGKMYQEGRNEGGYRCKHAKSNKCWNKATALRELTHRKICQAICEQLLGINCHLDVLVDFMANTWQDDTSVEEDLKRLVQQQHDVQLRCARLTAAIEKKDGAPQSLVNKLAEREQELVQIQAKLDEQAAKRKNKKDPPTREQFEDAIHEVSSQLLSVDREAGVILRKLIDGKIRAVPYQQFGSNKVVLRAHFRLRLAKFMPEDLYARLMNRESATAVELLAPIEMIVDLFEPNNAPKYAVQAYELAKQDGLSLAKIGKKLGISKRNAHLAKQLGKAMKEAGVSDPYIRLLEPPKNASRWRVRRRFGADENNDAA